MLVECTPFCWTCTHADSPIWVTPLNARSSYVSIECRSAGMTTEVCGENAGDYSGYEDAPMSEPGDDEAGDDEVSV